MHVAFLCASPLGHEKANGLGGKEFIPLPEIDSDLLVSSL